MQPPSPTEARPSGLCRPRAFDLIAFDWDGTLFDSTALITRCIQEAVRDVGGTVPTDAQASHVIGLGFAAALEHAAPDVPRSRYAELGTRYRHHYLAHEDDITLFVGVLPLLMELKSRRHWLAVATGKSRIGLDAALSAVELKGVFDASRTADQTAGKPDPRMLLELMRELETEPPRVLMVGDTTHDLQMAANAGCQSVAVSYGAHSPHAFAAFRPRFIAHSVAELGLWLRANA
ncbi:MAG: HAD-IA family hydrolase [Burkholderiaceae bacterium]